MMKKIFILLFIVCCFTKSYTQNLVANGGFDELNYCTEYRTDCAPEAWFFVPAYVSLPKMRDNNYYQQVAMGNLEKATIGTFIYTKLLCPLEKGKQYKITFRSAKKTFQLIDICFSQTEPTATRVKDIEGPKLFFIKDSVKFSGVDWSTVSTIYTANGDETYMIFGNYSHQPLSNYKKDYIPNSGTNVVTLLDDVSVIPVDTEFIMCPKAEAIRNQLYNQNRRHPSGLVEDIPIDTSYIVNVPEPKPNIPVTKPEIPVTIPDTITKKTDTLFFSDVLFNVNSSKINAAYATTLDSLATALQKQTVQSISITGHTDNTGSKELNDKLSLNRAISIKNYLMSKNITTPIIAKGKGSSEPIDTNTTAKGRKRNRRVEIIINY